MFTGMKNVAMLLGRKNCLKNEGSEMRRRYAEKKE